jgi:hypothetical protein
MTLSPRKEQFKDLFQSSLIASTIPNSVSDVTMQPSRPLLKSSRVDILCDALK